MITNAFKYWSREKKNLFLIGFLTINLIMDSNSSGRSAAMTGRGRSGGGEPLLQRWRGTEVEQKIGEAMKSTKES